MLSIARPRKRHTRAQKLYERKRWIAKRLRQARSFLSDMAEIVPGRYEKHDPFDCGHSKCSMCRRGEGYRSRRDKRLFSRAIHDLQDLS